MEARFEPSPGSACMNGIGMLSRCSVGGSLFLGGQVVYLIAAAVFASITDYFFSPETRVIVPIWRRLSR
jgi:hypothetical protein